MEQKKSENRNGKGTNRITAIRVSIISIVVNLALSALKLIAGIIAHSGAMISDAVHSASDVFSTFIVIIGVTISSKESDEQHRYGHERFECVASIILAVVLAVTGGGIGIRGMKTILAGNYQNLLSPGLLALIAAIISIGTKEWMYWYTRSAAKKINSGALMADAWHHRSDALSSIGALVGIVGSRMGFPILDSVASLIICIFIEKAAYDIFKDAIEKMVDKSCTEEEINQIRKIIEAENGVERIDEVKTRLFGSKIFVDVEFSTDGKQTLEESHAIAERVHNAIEDNFPQIKHCMVHVNPM